MKKGEHVYVEICGVYTQMQSMHTMTQSGIDLTAEAFLGIIVILKAIPSDVYSSLKTGHIENQLNHHHN